MSKPAGYTHTLRCIGIAPWGYIERNHCLVNPSNSMEHWQKSYTASNKIVPLQPVSLNPNHTHFLLVDDGIRGKYSGVAEFRANLERRLASGGNVRQRIAAKLEIGRCVYFSRRWSFGEGQARGAGGG